MKQLSLYNNPMLSHGGNLRVGKRKIARPLVTKSPLHVVLKSSRARGSWSFLRHSQKIESALRDTARKKNIKILMLQNVGNHIHLAIQGPRRKPLQDFFRVITQKIVFLVTNARKGKPIGKFWDALVFTRIVKWGKDWSRLTIYFRKNKLEAGGMPREEVDWLFKPAPQT